MDLDDRQQFTNGARNLVECAAIMREEIQKCSFSEYEAEQLLLVYWKAFVQHMFTPDFADIFAKMMPRGDN